MKQKYSTLCEIPKDLLNTKFEKVLKLVENPKYFCRKCARSANEKKYLCKPIKL